jgi:hypothetical protein
MASTLRVLYTNYKKDENKPNGAATKQKEQPPAKIVGSKAVDEFLKKNPLLGC